MDILIKNIKPIILFSGYYDFDTATTPFCVNNNFFYLTGIDIPNITILYNDTIECFFDFKDNVWYDNENYLKDIKYPIHDIKELEKYLMNVKTE